MILGRITGYDFTEGLPDVIDLNGKVVGSDGYPLENAHVLVSGTNQNTTTDENGNFQLNDVPYNATVTFSWQSSVVEKPAFRIGNQVTIEINALDEVLITNKPKGNKTLMYAAFAAVGLVVLKKAFSNKTVKARKVSL